MAREDGSSAYVYAQRLWGRATTARESNPTADVTPTQLINNNPQRMEWQLQNNSGADVFISLRKDVSTTNGFRVPANGGAITYKVFEDGETVGYDFYIVSTMVVTDLYLMEVLTV